MERKAKMTTTGLLVSLFAMLLALSVAPQSALATEPACDAWGNTKLFTYSGITVSHKSGIEKMYLDSSSNLITGWGYVKTSQSLAANKMGISGQLYDASGLLIKQTNPIWNVTGEKDIGAGASVVRAPGSKFYSGGRVHLSGTHIGSESCAYSPMVVCSIENEREPIAAQTAYQVNDKGLTYGSLAAAPLIGNEPDLVGVITDNGEEGYVFLSELDAASMSSLDGDAVTSIKVYDRNAETSIGEFTLAEAEKS